MRKTFLPFSPPSIGEEEIAEVVATLRTDWITTGPKVKRFEADFAAAVHAPAALALSSCTAALHVALATLGIGEGDAVITTPLTFCSTVHVIEQVGAVPIFADVDPKTLNIDPAQVRSAIETARSKGLKVKALLPVHLYGQVCDMDALIAIAQEHGLAIVEDAAHALPTTYKGKLIGDIAGPPVTRLTCFSFYATKNLTTAEGGMLTGPPELVDEARVWSLHGMSRDAWKRYGAEGSWFYEVVRPGFKYNMTDIQAALGLVQLRRLPEFHARRRQIVAQYNQALAKIEGLELPFEKEPGTHAWHLYVVRLKDGAFEIGRDGFIEQLRKRNIGSSVHFIPVHMHPYYRDKYGYKPTDLPVAYDAFRRMLSLPLAPRLTDEDVQDVIEAVSAIARESTLRNHAGVPSHAGAISD